MEVGIVKRIDRRTDGAFLAIQADLVLAGTRIGDSIAINGVDLTVTQMNPGSFSADASLETLSRTTLGRLRPGSRVNLERALAVGERLGGHMVQGHIDGTASLVSVSPEGNAWRVRFGFPFAGSGGSLGSHSAPGSHLARYVAMKGSITVDGISLTVAGLSPDSFEVVVIPHTWQNTTLSELTTGDPVNIEVDVLAKYVERLLETRTESAERASNLTLEYLIERGF